MPAGQPALRTCVQGIEKLRAIAVGMPPLVQAVVVSDRYFLKTVLWGVKVAMDAVIVARESMGTSSRHGYGIGILCGRELYKFHRISRAGHMMSLGMPPLVAGMPLRVNPPYAICENYGGLLVD